MSMIYTVGETTYDIVFRKGVPTGAVVGGSVLNTSITLGRLGLPLAFVSRMGNDQVGNLSINFIQKNNVCCDFVTRYEGNSRLALAFLDNRNNANYEFYKADKSPSLQFPELARGDMVLFGSTNAIKDEGRNSLLLFLNQAHDKNILTIYDPNIRESKPLEMLEIKKKVNENFHLSKIVKGSTEDFMRLFSTADAKVIFNKISKLGVEVLIITSGSGDVQLFTKSLSKSFSVQTILPVSTIGAGDNFTAGLIFGFKTYFENYAHLSQITLPDWEKVIKIAIDFSTQVCLSNENYISENFASEYVQKLVR